MCVGYVFLHILTRIGEFPDLNCHSFKIADSHNSCGMTIFKIDKITIYFAPYLLEKFQVNNLPRYYYYVE